MDLKASCDDLQRHNVSYQPSRRYHLEGEEQKHFQQQFADMYFLRLGKLKPAAEEAAAEAWANFEAAGETAQKKSRVLDVRQGELCWVVGTVYMDMPLKPNVLDDIAKDKSLVVPPPRVKYRSTTDEEQIMLEDESGRLRLVGPALKLQLLVTGCIVAVLGTENASGEFEVIDTRIPDLPQQPKREATGDSHGQIVLVSGLSFSGDEADHLALDLLMEYLLGEAGGRQDQSAAADIERLVIVGNSTSTADDTGKKAKKYGYDASAYNPAPITHLDNFLAAVLPTLPVTLMPGETDPSSISLPQQPLHPALLTRSRSYGRAAHSTDAGWLDSTTNPWEGEIDGWRFYGSSGQPVNDILKYVETNDRLEIMEYLLRWRNGAPTAPDTLWSYPYQEDEPFVLEQTPHCFFVGNQPQYESSIIQGPAGQTVRLVTVPDFKTTSQIVLVSLDTLETSVVHFDVAADDELMR